jgi:hypothetical protein
VVQEVVNPKLKFVRNTEDEPRLHFFFVLRQRAPEVEEFLREDSLPKYCAIPEALRQSKVHMLVYARLKNPYAFLFEGAEPDPETIRMPGPPRLGELQELENEHQSVFCETLWTYGQLNSICGMNG